MAQCFLTAKRKSGAPMNVVRITGGNPTIRPEIIVDMWHALKAVSPKLTCGLIPIFLRLII